MISKILWNFSTNDNNEVLHLIRMHNGIGLLRTTKELEDMGILARHTKEIRQYA